MLNKDANKPLIKNYVVLLLLTFFGIPINYLQLLPRRLWNLTRNILALFWFTKRNQFNLSKKPLPLLIRPIYYTGILCFKFLDLTGIFEILDFIFIILKFRSRSLTKIEIDELIKVFGTNFPYWLIRIDENSFFAKIGIKRKKKTSIGIGVVLFRSINFNRKINCLPGNNDMSWLVHEVMHVKQMQTIGSCYVLESILAQYYWDYNYENKENIMNLPLEKFNVEQQAQIIVSFYKNHLYGKDDFSIYENKIKEMNLGIL